MEIPRIPLSALRAFEVSSRHLSIKQAAAELCVTQGAVSQQVRQLEDRLAIKLFSRTSHGLRLTAEGKYLSDSLVTAFAQIDRTLASLLHRAVDRQVHLKLMPSLAIRWFVPRLANFYASHPQMEVEVGISARADDISIDEVDFAVRYGTGNWEDVEVDQLFSDELLPVCSRTVAQSISRPEDLLKLPLLHSLMRPNAWSEWLASAGIDEERCEGGVRFANSALACQAAVDGLGVALTQRSYVQDDLLQQRLFVPVDIAVQTRNAYYLVCSKAKVNQPKIKLFRAWIKTVV